MTWEEDVARVEAALEFAFQHGDADYRPALHRLIASTRYPPTVEVVEISTAPSPFYRSYD
jgi:hypothetical protein